MSKIAFVFPGQGAQYTGMAKDFYEKYAVSREVFESASKASGLDVKALCFEENDRLNITEYTQIAMLTAEIAILRAVEEAGIRSQVNAGLSLVNLRNILIHTCNRIQRGNCFINIQTSCSQHC